MFGEQAAFEKHIDENPLEAQNHLAYADWLDEHDQPDEAEFRRAMGKWVKNPSLIKNKLGEILKPGYPWATVSFPEGTSHGELVKRSLDERGHPVRSYFDQPHEGDPSHPIIGHTGVLYWPTYRGMEHAFRQSFMTGRTKAKLQRRVSRMKYSR